LGEQIEHCLEVQRLGQIRDVTRQDEKGYKIGKSRLVEEINQEQLSGLFVAW